MVFVFWAGSHDFWQGIVLDCISSTYVSMYLGLQMHTNIPCLLFEIEAEFLFYLALKHDLPNTSLVPPKKLGLQK
jgi:hypothetical protein